MSRKLLVAAVALTAGVTAAGVLLAPRTVAEVRGAPAPSLEASTTNGPARAAPPAVALLRSWDAERAAAWAAGDPALLRPLYTPASLAGREDRAMLRVWRARGLVVRDLRTQLLSVRELDRSGTTWTLLVTDRLAGGTAVGRGLERSLPRDQATTRTVRLRWLDGRWRVAAVRPVEG